MTVVKPVRHDLRVLVGGIVPDGFYDHVDNVNVPSKMQWSNCNQIGIVEAGIWANPDLMPYGVHQNSGNYSFVDGHAQTNSVRPFQDWWSATAGGGPGEYGDNAFTYPPELNIEGSVAGAEWWTIPWYPAGPIFDQSNLD